MHHPTHGDVLGDRRDHRFQQLVARQPEDVVDAVVLAPIERFRAAVVAVAPQLDLATGPVLAEGPADPRADDWDLHRTSRLARPQLGGDGLAAARRAVL